MSGGAVIATDGILNVDLDVDTQRCADICRTLGPGETGAQKGERPVGAGKLSTSRHADLLRSSIFVVSLPRYNSLFLLANRAEDFAVTILSPPKAACSPTKSTAAGQGMEPNSWMMRYQVKAEAKRSEWDQERQNALTSSNAGYLPDNVT